MARRCFDWICRRQQANETNWHARLTMIKSTAYAWLQMIFYLSFVTHEELADFLAWAESRLSIQQPDFQVRFGIALQGLVMATRGESPESRRFLGWSKSRHWLLQ